MSLRLYSTLTRTVQEFEPLDRTTVTMYVCGPTVYDDPHIGHARSAYLFDVLRRYLEHKDLRVVFVRNVTDVDDKIIEKARQETGDRKQKTNDVTEKCQEVAERYLRSYHDAMDRLGIGRPTEEPLATQHVVPEMTDVIATLLVQGAAYEAGGDVYFAVRKFPGYGKLSNRTLDELKAGTRVEPGEHKRDPLDFALWKAAKPGEPSWNSPWGKGRPGWHIECSAMSTKCLGDAFDIHGGGVDLVFPHHENEMAQANAAGKPFARYWVHNGLLTVTGEKMSKSLGNYVTFDEVLTQYPHPDYLKLLFLKTHYRSPCDYSPGRMDEAKKNWEEFSRFFQHYDQLKGYAVSGGVSTVETAQMLQSFEEAMDDDLNTPKALAVLFDLVNLGHRMLAAGDSSTRSLATGVHDVLLECGAILRLFLQGLSEETPETLRRIQSRIAERDAARKRKDFARADEMRRALHQEGIRLTDTPHETLWRRQR